MDSNWQRINEEYNRQYLAPCSSALLSFYHFLLNCCKADLNRKGQRILLAHYIKRDVKELGTQGWTEAALRVHIYLHP